MNKELSIDEAIKLKNEIWTFLGEDLEQPIKYDVVLNLNKLLEFVDPAINQQKELINKYGDNGQILLRLSDGTSNPAVEEFNKEFNPLLNKKINVDLIELEKSVLNGLKSKNVYILFFKYLIKQ